MKTHENIWFLIM